eukprot:644741-Amphidinium_carterae.1
MFSTHEHVVASGTLTELHCRLWAFLADIAPIPVSRTGTGVAVAPRHHFQIAPTSMAVPFFTGVDM